MRKAVIYVRVSTPQQTKNYSPPTQLDGCRQYAAQHGFVVVGEYVDTESGADFERTEFEKVRQLEGIDAVIVYVQDRLGRADELDTWNLIAEFDHRGVEVHCTDTGRIDLSDFVGQVEMILRAKIAKEERKKFLERGQRGRIGRCQAGKVIITDLAPYGYDYDPAAGQLIINEAEAEIVRWIFEWYVFGDGIKKRLGGIAIASKLTDMDVPTKYDTANRPKQKKGHGVWEYATVMGIIRAETYAGVWYYNHHSPRKSDTPRRKKERSEWVAVPVPAIVSHELWVMAQETRQANRAISRRNTQHEYLMYGRLSCAVCGSGFRSRADYRMNPEKPRLYYPCRGQERRYNGTSQTCRNSLPQPIVDSAIWDKIAEMLRNPAVIMESLQAEQNERQRLAQPDRNYLARCRKLLEKQHTRRERLLPLYLDGEYEKDELDRQKAAIDRECVDLENKIREIEGRLSGAEEFITGVESVQQYCERARRGIEHYTFEDRRGVMDLLNVKGTVYRQEDGAVMFRLTGYFPTIDVSFDVGSGLKLSRVDRQRNSWML